MLKNFTLFFLQICLVFKAFSASTESRGLTFYDNEYGWRFDTNCDTFKKPVCGSWIEGSYLCVNLNGSILGQYNIKDSRAPWRNSPKTVKILESAVKNGEWYATSGKSFQALRAFRDDCWSAAWRSFWEKSPQEAHTIFCDNEDGWIFYAFRTSRPQRDSWIQNHYLYVVLNDQILGRYDIITMQAPWKHSESTIYILKKLILNDKYLENQHFKRERLPNETRSDQWTTYRKEVRAFKNACWKAAWLACQQQKPERNLTVLKYDDNGWVFYNCETFKQPDRDSWVKRQYLYVNINGSVLGRYDMRQATEDSWQHLPSTRHFLNQIMRYGTAYIRNLSWHEVQSLRNGCWAAAWRAFCKEDPKMCAECAEGWMTFVDDSLLVRVESDCLLGGRYALTPLGRMEFLEDSLWLSTCGGKDFLRVRNASETIQYNLSSDDALWDGDKEVLGALKTYAKKFFEKGVAPPLEDYPMLPTSVQDLSDALEPPLKAERDHQDSLEQA